MSSWHPGEEDREPKSSSARGKCTLAPGLYVISTPIGNARDITLRALDVISAADLVLAEDTRVTAKLCSIHGLHVPLATYNDHNAARERPRILKRLQAGARVALVSDAGTPLVSDPGFKLVREVAREGLPVEVVPGPSAVLAALVLSALPSDRFLFAGFLPVRNAERRRVLEELRSIRATLIFFESPRRVGESLADIYTVFGERNAAVMREVTKLHQETSRGTLSALSSRYSGKDGYPRGEITIAVEGRTTEPPDQVQRLSPALVRAMKAMPLREAVDLIAEASGESRSKLYARALTLKDNAEA